MEGDDPLLVLVDEPILLFEPRDDAVGRRVDVVHCDAITTATCGQQRSLV